MKVGKSRLNSIFGLAAFTFVILGSGCPGDDREGFLIDSCEMSHILRSTFDDLEAAIHGIEKVKNGVLTDADIERLHRGLQNRLLERLEDGLGHDIVLSRCLRGKHPESIDCFDKNDGLVRHYQMDLRDAPLTGIFWHAYYEIERLREDYLTEEKEICIPVRIAGNGNPKANASTNDSNTADDKQCKNKIVITVGKTGFKESLKIQSQMMGFAQFGSTVEDLKRIAKGDESDYENLFRGFDRMKSNGVATFLALQCSKDEAFSHFLNGGQRPATGAHRVSNRHEPIDHAIGPKQSGGARWSTTSAAI